MAEASGTNKQDIWEMAHTPLTADTRIPASLKLNGQPIQGVPKEWNPVCETVSLPDAVRKDTITGTWEGLELRVERLSYDEFPVVEWCAFIKNTGDTDSPVISEFSITPPVFSGTDPRIHSWVGDNRTEEAYSGSVARIDGPVKMYPIGGCPCNGASPYFRLLFGEYGVNVAVGWPAQWCVDIAPVDGGISVAAYQQRLNTLLHAGEEIRSVRLTLMKFTGTETDGANLWRRWFVRYILAKENGQPLKPRAFGLAKPNFCEEYEYATTKQQLAGIEKFLDHGVVPDGWWLDAGWYPCRDKWYQTGTITPDLDRFPDALAKIGESCKKHGMDFLLWFEPERVTPDSELHREHPQWLLHRESLVWKSDLQSIIPAVIPLRDSFLLNLANDDATDWVIDRVDSIIKKAGVKVYREDFNISPLPFWVEHEGPDRVGSLENGYVRNLQRFWKTLLERNPGLWIDTCASGGRRNDLDTLRIPSVPLHYTDMCYGNHPKKQMHMRFMFEWIPYFKAQNTTDWDNDYGHYQERKTYQPLSKYSYYSGMGPSIFVTSHDGPDHEHTMLVAKKMLPVWRKAASLMLHSDYYPLSSQPHNEYAWFSDQFDAREEGFILFIRNTCAPDPSLTVHPKLEPSVKYAFTNSETGEEFVLSGEEAAAGLTVSLGKRSGTILFYRALR